MRTKITTLLGILIAVFGILSQPTVLALLPAKVATVINVIGVILTALGRSLLAPTNAPPANDEAK